MDAASQSYTDAELIQAIETNLFALFKHWLGGWPGVTLEETPAWIRTYSATRYRLCNAIMRTRLTADKLDTHIDEAIECSRVLNTPLLWWIEPHSSPADLGERLAARGFVHTQSFPGMAIDLRRLNAPAVLPDGVQIAAVQDEVALREWCTACVAGFEMPVYPQNYFESFRDTGFGGDAPTQLFLARLHGQPVASAMLFKEAGIAGLYNVGTIPSARGLGIGRAITLAAMDAGRQDGCHLATLYASKLGVNIYRQLGFTEWFQYDNYVWTPPQP
jgi:GNAT superfamily N-acetyltransferase